MSSEFDKGDQDLDIRAWAKKLLTERQDGGVSHYGKNRSFSQPARVGGKPWWALVDPETVISRKNYIAGCERAGKVGGIEFDYTTGTTSTGVRNSRMTCTDPVPVAAGDPAAGVPVVVTESDLRSLPIAAGVAVVDPPGGSRVPVQFPVIVSSPDGAQSFDIELLGTPVAVEVVPVAWTWDFGDGTVETYDSPGRPYPARTHTHEYNVVGEVPVTLTTTYVATYSVAGGEYLPVDGSVQVTSEPVVLTLKEYEARLVDDPYDE